MDNETLVIEIREAKNDTDRKELLSELYQRNFPLIRQICKRYSSYEELDDLCQTAFFGLQIAVERFDTTQGCSFMTYADLWIKAVLRRHIENNGQTVRLPANVRRDALLYAKTVSEFQKEHGCDPSDRELSAALGMTASKVMQTKKNYLFMSIVSLDAPLQASEDGLTTTGDYVRDPESEEGFGAVLDEIDNDIRSREIWGAVDSLGEIPAAVIRRRFQNCDTLREIGADIHKTGEQIRQIQNKALKRLKFSPVIRCYQDEYSTAFRGSGLNSFRHSGTSSTERMALEHYTDQVERYQKKVERTMKRVQKKYGIEIGSDYIDMKVKEYEDSLKAATK